MRVLKVFLELQSRAVVAQVLNINSQLTTSLIDGSKVDFVDTLIEKSFKILNPKATSSCGCGTSFSI